MAAVKVCKRCRGCRQECAAEWFELVQWAAEAAGTGEATSGPRVCRVWRDMETAEEGDSGKGAA